MVEENDVPNQAVPLEQEVHQITVKNMVEGNDVLNQAVHPVQKVQQITVSPMVEGNDAPIVSGGLIPEVVMLNMTGIVRLVSKEYFQMTPDQHTFTNIQKR